MTALRPASVAFLLFCFAAGAQSIIQPKLTALPARPGGVAQVQLGLAQELPVSSAFFGFYVGPEFRRFEDVSLYHLDEAAYGIAVYRNETLRAFMASPLGATISLSPFLVASSRISAEAPSGRTVPLAFHPATVFYSAGSHRYAMATPAPGAVSIQNTGMFVESVRPNTGVLPAGTLVTIKGAGFTADSQVAGLPNARITIVNSNEITAFLYGAAEIAGSRIQVSNNAGASARFFIYEELSSIGLSSVELINDCHPLFPRRALTKGAIAYPDWLDRNGLDGIAIRNPGSTTARVELEFEATSGVFLTKIAFDLPPGGRIVRSLPELGSPIGIYNNPAVRIQSSQPVQAMGFQLDLRDYTAVAFAAESQEFERLFAVPTPDPGMELSFVYDTAGRLPPSRSVFVFTASRNQVRVTATSSASWVSITPDSFTTSTSVQVTVNPAGLAVGDHQAIVTVRGPGLLPAIVPLRLRILGTPYEPEMPSHPWPPDGATGIPNIGRLSWTMLRPKYSSYYLYASVDGKPEQRGGSLSPEVDFVFGPGQTVQWRVLAVNGYGQTSSPVWKFTTASENKPKPATFVPIDPCRVLDTRTVGGLFGGPALFGGSSRDIPISRHACLSGAQSPLAYSLNVTVVPRRALGYLTVLPSGSDYPTVSLLNSLDGRVKANAAIVAADLQGSIRAQPTDDTDLVVDVNGYFVGSDEGLGFYPLPPCRILDTRTPAGAPSLAPKQTRTIPVRESPCGVPADAQAYALNATSIPKGPLGYLTLWPSGKTQPATSTLNALTGVVTANAAIVAAGADGAISAFATDASDLVIDINGYFAPLGKPGALHFRSIRPCRALDTRLTQAPLVATFARNFRLDCDPIPSIASAVTLNATVLPQGVFGYLSLWPGGSAQPVVSTLNAVDGSLTSNAAIVPVGPSGVISVFGSNAAHLLLDISGYFARKDLIQP